MVEPFEGTSANNLFVGTLTGAIVLAMTNPFWVVKTRLCLQYETQEAKTYKGMTDCYRKIVKHEGFMGLYKVPFLSIFKPPFRDSSPASSGP